MKTEKSCGCIILKDNQVLLIGAKDDGGKLFWSFPKGHQENGETDIETAIRETNGGTVYKNILLFIAKPLNYELKPQEEEVEQVKWVQINGAGKYFTGYYSDAWKELLKRLRII